MSKIRSYTNGDLDVVEVTEEHLAVAVEIKLELQKLSPSLRCDWKKHKQMMQEEGYYDSDTNEAYRCLVKDFQSKGGLLKPVHKHVDMVATSKLKSLGRMLGELYSEKRENQLTLQEINKFKRDFSLSKVIAEEIIEEFKFKGFQIDQSHFKPKLQGSNNKAIVVLTDLHVGAVINDVYGNYYNYEIAKKRMSAYLSQVITYCKSFNITSVDVVGLGDFVEHVNMRYKQSDEAEFKLAKQILKASELVLSFLIELSQHVNVDYSGIAGNHDRLQGDKNIAFDDDNANVIINSNIEQYIKLAKLPRLSYSPTADGATEINKELNGRKIKLVHGHLDNGDKKDRLKSYISMQEEFFDCLINGHLHNFKVLESDNGRLSVQVGCLSGRNNYSKALACATNASQMMFVVTEDGNMLPLRVDLQIV